MSSETPVSNIATLERALAVTRRFEAAGWKPTVVEAGQIVLNRDGRNLSIPTLDEKKWEILENSMALALRFEAAGWFSTLVDVGKIVFERDGLTLSAHALESGRWHIQVTANYNELDIDAWTKLAAAFPADRRGKGI